MTSVATLIQGQESASGAIIDPTLVQLENGRPTLRGGHCAKCGALSFPRAEVCAECLGFEIEDVALPSEGELYAFSIVHQAPRGWRTPYAIGYVDLSNGVRVFTHLEPIEQMRIGLPVQLGLAAVADSPDGEPLQTYVFEPRR